MVTKWDEDSKRGKKEGEMIPSCLEPYQKLRLEEYNDDCENRINIMNVNNEYEE